MEQRIEHLKLSNISKDQKFNLNSTFGFNRLKESIASIGIIYPLLAWKHNNSIQLIDGFKRLKIAKNSGKTELSFIILPSNFNLDKIIKIRYHNIKQEDSELNAHQKLSIYSILKEANKKAQNLNEWQKILNLSKPEKYQNILSWPKIARDYIYNYNVSIKQLRILVNQTNQIIEEFFHLASSLSIRIVELTSIAEIIYEIALNENVSMISILKRDQIKSIIQNEHLNRNQKILKLKSVLFKWRYPTIAKYQRQLDDQLKELSFTNNTIIHYDKSFEKPEIVLTTILKNLEDLNRFSDLINNYSNKKVFRNILASL